MASRTLTGTNGSAYTFDDTAIDADSSAAFTQGHCHSMAVALHDLTGWPIIGICNELFECVHVGCVAPSGRFVDIDDAQHIVDVIDQYNATQDTAPYARKSYSRDRALNLFRAGAPEAARTLAEQVLRYETENLPPSWADGEPLEVLLRVGDHDLRFEWWQDASVSVQARLAHDEQQAETADSADWVSCAAISIVESIEREMLLSFDEASLLAVAEDWADREYRHVRELLGDLLGR